MDTQLGLPSVRMPFYPRPTGSDVLDALNPAGGEVALTLPLAELPGAGGTAFPINAYYRSSCLPLLSVWNREAPTSSLGAGWSLAFDFIVKSAPSLMNDYGLSDNYQIMTPTGPRRLYKVGRGDEGVLYQTEEYFFWKILFQAGEDGPTSDHWTITREDGTVWTYGGGSATELRAAWDNWTDPSVAAGASCYAASWHLKTVTWPEGYTVKLEYEQDRVPTGQAESTRALRLASVTGVHGHRAELRYGTREARELDPPHKADAYQFVYDDKYLADITVRSPQGDELYIHELEYDLLDPSDNPDEGLAKRYLSRSVFVTPAGRRLDNLALVYSCRTEDFGVLRGLRFPGGGRLDFTHKKRTLDGATCNLALTAARQGAAPGVWHGPSHSVAAFLSPGAHSVELCACRWRGVWEIWRDEELLARRVELLDVLNGADLFAVHYRDAAADKEHLRLYHADIYRPDQWLVHDVELGPDYAQSQVALGGDFVALLSPGLPRLEIFQWDGTGKEWQGQTVSLGQNFGHVALGAGPGFVAAALHDGAHMRLQLFRADADRVWGLGGYVDMQQTVNWELTRPGTVWSLSASCAAATFISSVDEAAGTATAHLALLRWSEDYMTVDAVRRDVSQTIDVTNPIARSLVSDSIVSHAQNVYRHDAGIWREAHLFSCRTGHRYAYAAGSDLILAVESDPRGRQRFTALRYDPIRQDWTDEGVPAAEEIQDPEALFNPAIAGDYALLGRELHRRDPDECWRRVRILPEDVCGDSLCLGLDYLAFRRKGSPDTRVLFLKNGRADEEQTLYGENCVVSEADIAQSPTGGLALAGPQTLATYRGEHFGTATALRLRRVHDKAMADRVTVTNVTGITLAPGADDAGAARWNIDYDPAGAIFDPDLSTADYASVTVTHPRGGSSRFRFVNRTPLDGDAPDASETSGHRLTNVNDYYGLLRGQLLERQDMDPLGREISRQINDWHVWREEDGHGLYGVFARIARTGRRSTLDSDPPEGEEEPPLCGHTVYTYNGMGQVAGEETENRGVDGRPETLVTAYRYAWEQYDGMRRAHRLAPRVRTTRHTVRDGVRTLVSDEQTVWREDWGTVTLWAPAEDRRFRSDQGPDGAWITVREIKARGAYGLPLDTRDIDGIPSALLCDAAGRFPLAAVAGAAASECAFWGFEAYEPQTWTLSGQAALYDGEAFAGRRCLRLERGGAVSGALTAHSALGAKGPYQISCRYKNPGPGREFNASWTVDIQYADGSTGRNTWPLEHSGVWNLFWTRVDADSGREIRSLSFRLRNEGAEPLLVDAVFLMPLEVRAKGVFLNEKHSTETEMDARGNERTVFSDAALTAVLTDSTLEAPSFDMLYRPGTDAPDRPEAALSVRARSAMRVAHFRRGDEWQQDFSGTGTVRDGKLILDAGGRMEPVLWRDSPEAALCLGFRARAGLGNGFSSAAEGVSANRPATPGFRLTFRAGGNLGGDAADYALTAGPGDIWTLEGPDLKREAALASPDPRCLLWAVGGRCLFFVDGTLLFNEPLAADAASLALETRAPLELDRLFGVTDPITGLIYRDGLGRDRQQHQLEGPETAVTELFYDAEGNQDVRTRAVRLREVAPWPVPDFATLDRSAWTLDGKPAERWPEDEGRPYWREVRAPLPDRRVIEQWLPGKALSGGGRVVRQRQRTRLPEELVARGAVPGTLVVSLHIDQDGLERAEIRDMQGREVGGWSGTEDSPELFYRTMYGPLGKPERLEQPRAMSEPEMIIHLRHDAWGRETERIEPDKAAPVLSLYDAAGRLRFRRDAASRLLYWSYDALGRTLEEGVCRAEWDEDALKRGIALAPDWLPGPGLASRTWRYGRDRLDTGLPSRCETVNQRHPVVELFQYDLRGKVSLREQKHPGAAGAASRLLRLERDRADNVRRVQAGSAVTEYGFDAAGRPARVCFTPDAAHPAVPVASYRYDDESRLEEERLHTGGEPISVRRRYLGCGWLAELDSPYFSQTLQYYEGEDITPSWAGRLTRCTETFRRAGGRVPDRTVCRYAYDTQGRLTEVVRDGRIEFGSMLYDANSNLLSMSRNSGDETGVRYAYSQSSNQLAEVEALAESFVWDEEGRLRSSARRRIEDMEYDPVLGRLTGFSSDSGRTTLAYDARGTRVYANRAGREEYSLSGGKGRILWRGDAARTDGGDHYIHGPGGLVAVWREGRTPDESGGLHLVIKDRLGSTRSVIRAADGAVMEAWVYDAFGAPLGAAAPAAGRLCPFLFAGQEMDETGWYAFHARLYDPLTGRFLAPDPKREYPSPYLYCGGDPINCIDPFGEDTQAIIRGVSIAVGIVLVIVGIAVIALTAGAATPAVGAAGAGAGGAAGGGAAAAVAGAGGAAGGGAGGAAGGGAAAAVAGVGGAAGGGAAAAVAGAGGGAAAGGSLLSSIVVGGISGALIGAGSSSFFYGVGSGERSWNEWGKSVGISGVIGFVSGAITGGLSHGLEAWNPHAVVRYSLDFIQQGGINAGASTLDNLAQGANPASGAIHGALAGAAGFLSGAFGGVVKGLDGKVCRFFSTAALIGGTGIGYGGASALADLGVPPNS